MRMISAHLVVATDPCRKRKGKQTPWPFPYRKDVNPTLKWCEERDENM
ncbi:hypothetical protein POPTR_004G174301v4 [Populus trichocarpa]|uniref:Uncharacterized protein n=1 Tax=Populus trichocarpa TaxID=3694 RepID=A0ACC0T583_POPTR|nr:hypothetical protein POPTR_004G174301v4 [Populus trichocarpa]